MNRAYSYRKLWLRRIFQLAAIGLLGAGFASKSFWLGGLAVIGLVILAWVGERFHKPWLSSAVLFTSTGIAAGGIWVGTPPIYMISGVIAALAWSELTGNPASFIRALDPHGSALVELLRIRLLVILIVGSLLVTGFGLLWKWHLSFAFIFLIAAFICFGLFGLFRILKNLHP
jgi:hypothetical protein